MINEEVTPKLERLWGGEEERSYLLGQKTCTELEPVGRTLRAWEYMEVIQRVIPKEKEIADAEEEGATMEKEKSR